MLAQAGIGHAMEAAGIDESELKAGASKPAQMALELAKAKAVAVSRRRPDDWTIGSDSIVSVGGRRFDKPADRKQAAEHLRYFSGKVMILTSAVALARRGQADWAIVDEARLQVRDLSHA